MWRHFLQYLPGATIAYFLRLDHHSEAIPSARIHQKTLPMFCIQSYLLLSLQTKIDPVIYRQSSSFGFFGTLPAVELSKNRSTAL